MMTPNTPFKPFTPLSAFVVPVPTPPAEAQPVVSASMTLARAASRGDTLAMRSLLREIGPRVQRVVRAVLGREHQDAEDVTQQAMLGFVQALPSFRGECEPAAFASRVAARTAIAAARRGRVARARHEDGVDIDLLTASSTLDGAAQAASTPLADAERTRRMAAMRDALSRIPVEQAETLAMRIVLGWSLAEVADATGVPLNTVRSRLRLAKTALRSVIDCDPVTHEELGDDRF